MHLDKKFLQRALLAFTTGLFLACAARVSAAQTTSVIPSAARDLLLINGRSTNSEIATPIASPSLKP